MTWNFKSAWFVFAGLLWASTLVHAADRYPPVTVDVTPQPVTDNVWFFRGLTGTASQENEGFMSNAGFVVTDEGVVAFDALGTPSLGARMIREIGKITDKPIVQLVVSHYHADHFYGLPAFAAKRVPILAHRYVVTNYLKSQAPLARLKERRSRLKPWVNQNTRIKPPDVTLEFDKSFSVGGMDFKVIHAGPSHTPEDLMLYAVQAQVLFTGDLVFSGRAPWVGNANTKGWLKALEKVIALKPKFLVPGHGDMSSNAIRDLKATYDYLTFLRDQMGRGVDDLLEFEEIYQEVDWQAFKDMPLFDQVNRRNAYNTFIQMQRESLEQ